MFSVKYKEHGSLERYKARLVAKGYTQTCAVDYSETFAPMAKMSTIRIVLALPAQFNWDIQQYDVKNTFLHGELEEEIYVKGPLGFQVKVSKIQFASLRKHYVVSSNHLGHGLRELQRP